MVQGARLAALLAVLSLGVVASPAAAAGTIDVSPDRAFGNVLVGQTSSQSVTVSNTAGGTMNVTSVTLSGTSATEFSVSNACDGAVIASGGNCVVSVTFAPTSVGLKSATLTVVSDASSGDNTASLSGAGVQPVLSFGPTSLSFGNQPVGTSSAAQTLTIENTGSATLSISGIAKAGTDTDDFTIESNACLPLPRNLAVGQSCTLDVRFAPIAAGARSASVRVTSNAPPTGQDDAPLSGTGTVPELSIDPSGLSFADQIVGTSSATRSLTIHNSGDADLVVSSIAKAGANPGDFTIASNGCLPLPKTLAAGQECTLAVGFTPTVAGARAASLHVGSNAGDGDAPLSGTASAPTSDPGTGGGGATTEQTPTTPAIQTTTTPTGSVPTPTVAPVVSCRVPRLKGKTLAAARRALRRAHCALGKVRRAQSKRRPGRVLRQSRKPGRRLRKGTRVALVISRR